MQKKTKKTPLNKNYDFAFGLERKKHDNKSLGFGLTKI